MSIESPSAALPWDAILSTGQRIRHNGCDGIITRIIGEQAPKTCGTIGGVILTGGSAYFQITFSDGSRTQVPEAIFRGHKGRDWQALAAIADAAAIEGSNAVAEDKIQRLNRESEEKQAAFDREMITLAQAHPELETRSQTKLSTHALAAKNIRTQLKTAFPGIKFSVTSDSFSGGNSVRIKWTDGPTSSEVEAITGRYQEGNFNGMEDIYEYRRSPWTEVFGSSKYVQTSRSISEPIMKTVGKQLCEIHGIPYEGHRTAYHIGGACDLANAVWRWVCQFSIPADCDPALIVTGYDTNHREAMRFDGQPIRPKTTENTSRVKHSDDAPASVKVESATSVPIAALPTYTPGAPTAPKKAIADALAALVAL